MSLYKFPNDPTRARYRPRHRRRRIERQERLEAAWIAAEPVLYSPSPELPNDSVVMTAEAPHNAAEGLLVQDAA